jgi:hypothetical protein
VRRIVCGVVFGSGGRPSRTIVDAMRTEGVERYIGMATPACATRAI